MGDLLGSPRVAFFFIYFLPLVARERACEMYLHEVLFILMMCDAFLTRYLVFTHLGRCCGASFLKGVEIVAFTMYVAKGKGENDGEFIWVQGEAVSVVDLEVRGIKGEG